MNDISLDGRTVVGEGRNADGHREGWIAYLGAICRADFNEDGTVNTLDLIAFLSAYNAADWVADFNFDGRINTRDFIAFLNAYNDGCP